MANLPYHCSIPQYQRRHLPTRLSHHKYALSEEIARGCVSPQRLIDPGGKWVSYCRPACNDGGRIVYWRQVRPVLTQRGRRIGNPITSPQNSLVGDPVSHTKAG